MKLGRALQRFGISVAASMASGLAFGAMGSPYFAYFYFKGRNAVDALDMVSRADLKFLYALDATSDDVTVIDIGKRAVSGVIPVGKWCSGLVRHPSANQLYALSKGVVTVIDTDENSRAGTFAYGNGALKSLLVDEVKGRVLLATDSQLLVFDGKSSTPIVLTGLQNAVFLAQQ